MNEQELQAALASVCNGTNWTLTYAQSGNRWKCNACGHEVQDNLTISASLIFGPHYKPGCEPRTFEFEVR